MENLKTAKCKETCSLIPEFADQLLCKAVEHDIYIHDKWVSFKDKGAKRKQVSMEKPDVFSLSCSASTAVKAFRSAGAKYGLFFGELMEGKYTCSYGNYNAAVLILEKVDKTDKKAYLFSPYQIESSPPLACTVVYTWSTTVKHIIVVKGTQNHDDTTSVIDASNFAKEFVRNPTEILESFSEQMYSLPIKYKPRKK